MGHVLGKEDYSSICIIPAKRHEHKTDFSHYWVADSAKSSAMEQQLS